jgi:hypothetical protein
MTTKEQPIGIIPHWLWLEKRMKELTKTIQRYVEWDPTHEAIAEWAHELETLARLRRDKFMRE